MQSQAIDSIIKEVNNILSQFPADKKVSQNPRNAFSILKATLEEKKYTNTDSISQIDFRNFLHELQEQSFPKAILLSFTIISQIVSVKLIYDVNVFEEILTYLKFARSISDDDNFQLKLSQLAGTTINTDFLEFFNLGYLEKCLFILLHLKDSKNIIISSIAKTRLQSIINTVCQNHKDKLPQIDPQVLAQARTSVSKLIVDLIFIIDGQKQNWYPQTSTIERELGIQWLNSILLDAKDLVFDLKDNLPILQFNLIPACKRVLKQYQPPYLFKDIRHILVIQIFRCFTRLIEGNLAEFQDLFEIFIKYIANSENSFCKTMSLECSIYFVRTKVVLDSLLSVTEFNEQKNCFLKLLSTITEVSKSIEPTQQDIEKATSGLMTEHLESNDLTEITLSNHGIVKLISDFQFLYAATLVTALQTIQAKDLYRKFIRVVEHTSKYSLNSIRAILSKETNETIVEVCLNAISKMILLLGEVFNKQIQSEFILILTENSLPTKEQSKLTMKNLLILKTILKILQLNGSQIDFNGWLKLLKTLNDSEKFINQNRIIRQGTHEEVLKFQTLNTIQTMFEDLFKKSHQYNDNMFLTMLDALNQVTLKDMSEQALYSSKVSNHLFSQMPNTLKINFYRIDIFWELVTAHLLILSNSKQSQIRDNGSTHLSQLVIMGFQYMAKYYKLKPLEDLKREQERQIVEKDIERRLQQDEINKQERIQQEQEMKENLQKLQDIQIIEQLNVEQQTKESTKEEKPIQPQIIIDEVKVEIIVIEKPQNPIKSAHEFNINFDNDLPDDFNDDPQQSPFGIQEQFEETDPREIIKNQDDTPVSNHEEKEIVDTSNQIDTKQGQEIKVSLEKEIQVIKKEEQNLEQNTEEFNEQNDLQDFIKQPEQKQEKEVDTKAEVEPEPPIEKKDSEQTTVLIVQQQNPIQTEVKDTELTKQSTALDRNFEKFSTNQTVTQNVAHLIEKSKWNEDQWQKTILSPWVHLLTIKYTETKLIIMDSVLSLLQSNGHQISKGGWESIINILYEASQDQTSGFAKQGLKSVELMINLYLSMIDQEKVPIMFEIIENFRRNSSDLNVNFEFCDMLWHFGDYLSKMNSSYNELKTIFMKKIFAQLSKFCLEDNKEIRNQSLHIVCNLLLHSSSSLGCTYWGDIFENYYFPVMKDIINIQYEKIVSDESDSGQWQTTCRSLVRTSNKLFKRYFQLLDEEYPNYTYIEIDQCQGNHNDDPKFRKLKEINNVQINFLNNMATLLNQLQMQMHLEIVEALKEMFMLKPYENQLIQEAFLDNLQYVRMIFTMVPSSIIYTKVILHQVTAQVLQYISLLIKQYYPWKRLNQNKYIESLVSLYLIVLAYPTLVQQTHTNLKIIQEYSLYIKPFESFIQFASTYPEQEDVITKLLQQVFTLAPTHVFNDFCIRNFTQRGISFVLNKSNFRLSLSLKILQSLSQIMEHRWKNNYHRWFYSFKRQQSFEYKDKEVTTPIWQFAYENLFELAVQILLQPSKPYDKVFDIIIKNYDVIQSNESISLLATYLQESQLQLFLVLESKSLQFLYKKFLHSPFAIINIYTQLNDKGKDKILQMTKDFAWVLFQIASPENYYEPIFKGQVDDNKEGQSKMNISLQSFKYLIELIHFQDSQNIDEDKLQEKGIFNKNITKDKQQIWMYYLRERSKIVLPFLLAKINILLKQYMKQYNLNESERLISDDFIEEILNLSVSLRIPQNSFPLQLDTDHHLGDVHQLKEPENSNLLKGDSGHLFFLFPLLIQLSGLNLSKGIKIAVQVALEKIYAKLGFIKA